MKRGSGVLIYTPKAYIYGCVYIFGTYIFGVEVSPFMSGCVTFFCTEGLKGAVCSEGLV